MSKSKPKHRRRTGAGHLVSKRGALWARRRVPLDLVDQVGASDLTKPLGTTSTREATKLAEKYNAQLDAGFSAIRAGLAPTEGVREWLRAFADRVMPKLQEQVDESLAESLSDEDADDVAEAYADAFEVLAEPVHDGEPWAIEAALKLVGEDPSTLPVELHKRLAVASLRALKGLRFDAHSLPQSSRSNSSSTSGPTSSPASDAIARQLEDLAKRMDGLGKAKRAKTLGDALTAYVTLKVQRGDWKTAEHQAAVKLGRFVAAVGPQRELDEVTAEEVADFLGSLMARQDKPADVGTKTLHHSGINAFYLEAIRQEWATRNPANGLRPKKSIASHESRDAFTDAELVTTFSQTMVDEALGSRQRTKVREVHMERLWGPLLSLTMTLRANEAAQLHLEDIVTLEGIHCLRVAPDEETDRKVKNRTSIRTVPVPQALIDLGFMDFVDQRRTETANDPKAPLFPALEAIGDHGFASRMLQWFGGQRGYLNRMGVKRKGLTFHSLRHSAIDRLHRAGVDGITRSAIEGHARTGGVGETTYIKGATLADMKAAIDSVDWAPVLGGLREALGK